MGLRSLLLSSGYKNLDSTTISFGVAPRINACGRMGHADEALNLFLSKDIYEVNELTKKLNDYNKMRQEKEKSIYEDAVNQIEKNKLYENCAIVVGGDNWHHGVIGIVSSKITDLYFKPSILLCYDNELAKGSGRSIPGFDLHDALMKCQDTIEKFGGHSMAIGITIKKDNFDKFANELEQIAKDSKIDEIVPIINVDAKINLNQVSRETVESLKQLEPFGEGNKTPIFALKNLKVDSIRSFDVESQRSTENLQEIEIYPATENWKQMETESFLAYFPVKETILFLDEPVRLQESAEIVEKEYFHSLESREEAGMETDEIPIQVEQTDHTIGKMYKYYGIAFTMLESKC